MTKLSDQIKESIISPTATIQDIKAVLKIISTITEGAEAQQLVLVALKTQLERQDKRIERLELDKIRNISTK